MRDSESVQPLPCLVRTDALSQVQAVLERRELKLLPLLRSIAGTELCLWESDPERHDRLFSNINTPEDYESAQTNETAGSSLHQSKHGRRAAGK